MNDRMLLTAIVFLPLAGALIVALLPRESAAPKWVAAAFAGVDLREFERPPRQRTAGPGSAGSARR